MAALNGTWVLEKSENFEEFMKELGVGLILRKVGNTVTPTLIISNNGNEWSIKMRSTFKNTDDNFTLGEEFDDETTDGRKIKCLYNLDGDKLICEQRDRKTRALQVTAVRSIDENGKMVEVLTCKTVVAKRYFKRVE
uniref:Fatty acid-binding protein C n=1 Tax=Brachionus koreanus TaxID=1199090 RepID=A0AA49KFG9_9BILA|nr:fatty acid-binding protein C [Brachionus koreanus]